METSYCKITIRTRKEPRAKKALIWALHSKWLGVPASLFSAAACGLDAIMRLPLPDVARVFWRVLVSTVVLPWWPGAGWYQWRQPWGAGRARWFWREPKHPRWLHAESFIFLN